MDCSSLKVVSSYTKLANEGRIEVYTIVLSHIKLNLVGSNLFLIHYIPCVLQLFQE